MIVLAIAFKTHIGLYSAYLNKKNFTFQIKKRILNGIHPDDSLTHET